ncbi:hypothetical protein, partial [Nocardia cyriacigeorgica]|uniref:hypothetical protein n=1 Tax=Nocardia cyriacigeorgica TaxID=135487 RepID=UPI002456B812
MPISPAPGGGGGGGGWGGGGGGVGGGGGGGGGGVGPPARGGGGRPPPPRAGALDAPPRGSLAALRRFFRAGARGLSPAAFAAVGSSSALGPGSGRRSASLASLRCPASRICSTSTAMSE